ncbi:signal peptidase I [Glutamicibacter arilaitensis]|uniref:Signal peptidase I n=1 Tax=Glutamicibacter arilaitensis (strain DSM 16368 / CIP 108037 / IAM 15318 / JCM 13566 / NCIMB 14258 / Re117) TaxID=861360 RepID=A0ABP1U7Y9_GLUAR|nr:signal peptidase I [Glutamicibacter arilaitensis]CBT77107.1 hypothetical membrane protein [Glutamicibacter arilaitensis Re117]
MLISKNIALTLKNALRSRLIHICREVLLTTGAILGALCILLTVASLVWNIKPLVFRSGSMSPTIETGALAFSKPVPASELAVGDVVSVETADESRVTHRITRIEVEGPDFALTLRGDANNVDDAESYVVDSADRVFFTVPKAGYAVSWLSGSAGTFVGGVVVGLVVIVFLRRPRTPSEEAATREDL